MRKHVVGSPIVAALAAVGSYLAPEPTPAPPLPMVAEFAAVINAPDAQIFYTPAGGFVASSDSTGWRFTAYRTPVEPRAYQRVYLSRGVQADDVARVFELRANETTEVSLAMGRWFLAVEDTAYGLSGFYALDVDSCAQFSCFELTPPLPDRGTLPIYALQGGLEPALQWPTNAEVDHIRAEKIHVRLIDQRGAYMRFAVYDIATKTWGPYGGTLRIVAPQCGS